MITVVAQLLNHPARISRVLKEAPNGFNPSSGRRTSSTSNSDSEQDEEEIGELLRDVMTSQATGAYALTLKDVCLRSIHKRPLLNCLNLYQHQPASTDDLNDPQLRATAGAMVPAGGIIGLRKSPGLGPEIDWMMLQLLGGWMLPDSGIARVLPSLGVALVSGVNIQKALFKGSLQDNLTYGIAWPVEDDALWQLCRRCGLSEQTIGAGSAPGWAEAKPFDPMVIPSPSTLSDNCIIVLVRALLQKPDVLLLHCVGELWGTAQQAHLIRVVRAYLDGSLELTKFGSSRAIERPRTVLWAASDSLLISAMKRETAGVPRPADKLITLESNSVATLSKPDEVFSSLDLDGTREIAQKSVGAFQLLRSKARPNAGPTLGATADFSATITEIPEEAPASAAEAEVMAVATAVEEEGSALAKMVPMAVQDSAAGAAAAAAAAGPSTAGSLEA